MEREPKNKTIRTTVSVSEQDREELLRIAEKKKVSLAWVVREAIDRYLTAESPLFPREKS